MKFFSGEFLSKHKKGLKRVFILLDILLLVVLVRTTAYPWYKKNFEWSKNVAYGAIAWDPEATIIYEKSFDEKGEQTLTLRSTKEIDGKIVATGGLTVSYISPFHTFLSNTDPRPTTVTTTQYVLITRAGAFTETMSNIGLRKINSVRRDENGVYGLFAGPDVHDNPVHCIREIVKQNTPVCAVVEDMLRKKLHHPATIVDGVWNKQKPHEALFKVADKDGSTKFFTVDAWDNVAIVSTEDYYLKNRDSDVFRIEFNPKNFFEIKQFGPFIRVHDLIKQTNKYTFVPAMGKLVWVGPYHALILSKFFGNGYAVDFKQLVYAALPVKIGENVVTAYTSSTPTN